EPLKSKSNLPLAPPAIPFKAVAVDPVKFTKPEFVVSEFIVADVAMFALSQAKYFAVEINPDIELSFCFDITLVFVYEALTGFPSTIAIIYPFPSGVNRIVTIPV